MVRAFAIGFAEVAVFNLLILLSGMWTVKAMLLGNLTAALTIALNFAKYRFGFYEKGGVSPVYGTLMAEGISLFIVFMYMLLIKWRIS